MLRMSVLCFGLVVLAGAGSADAAPSLYSFTQGGIADSDGLFGNFVGDDLNDDNIISFVDGEVSDFALTFTGTSEGFPVVDFDFGDLTSLVYELDGGGPFADSVVENLQANNGTYRYHVGEAFFETCGLGIDCAIIVNIVVPGPGPRSEEVLPITVSAVSVPAPSALGLLGFGIAALGLRRRQ